VSGDMSNVLRAMYSPWSPPCVAADLLDAIDALHQPEAQFDREWCCVCFTEPWPCKTHSLLHPEGGPS
jgi:hypothetical protein